MGCTAWKAEQQEGLPECARLAWTFNLACSIAANQKGCCWDRGFHRHLGPWLQVPAHMVSFFWHALRRHAFMRHSAPGEAPNYNDCSLHPAVRACNSVNMFNSQTACIRVFMNDLLALGRVIYFTCVYTRMDYSGMAASKVAFQHVHRKQLPMVRSTDGCIWI